MRLHTLRLPALLAPLLLFQVAGLITEVVAQPPVRTLQQWQQALHKGDLDERRQAALDTLQCDLQVQRELLPDLIDLLRNESDGQIRLAVLDTLTQMGPAASTAVPVLTDSMKRNFGGRYNEEVHQDYRAAIALARMGEPAVEGLRNLLTEERENLRAEAAMALGRIGPAASAAVDDLVKLLSDPSERVRKDAIVALGSIGSVTVDRVLTTVSSDQSDVRAAAVEALTLAAPADERVRDAVVAALKDPSSEVRAAATYALKRTSLPADTMRQSLLDALRDEEDLVRVAAVNVLAGQRENLEEMKHSLQPMLIGDNDEVAWHAAYLVHMLGSPAVSMLLETATNPQSRLEQLARALSMIRGLPMQELYAVLESGHQRQRQMVALALGQIRPVHPETIHRLTKIVTATNEGSKDDDANLQSAVLSTFEMLGAEGAAAIPEIRKLRNHTDARIRRQVIDVWMAAAARDRQLVSDLIDKLNDPDPNVERTAIDGLRTLGVLSRPAIERVIPKLDHADMSVRVSATAFLGNHGSLAAAAVPKLREQLTGGPATWRITVIETLGQMGAVAQEAVVELDVQREDPSAEVRAAAIKAISQLELDPQQLRAPLIEALRDSEDNVRYEATSGIRRLGERGVQLVPDLIPLLQVEHSHDDVDGLLDRLDRYPTDTSSVPGLVELIQNADKRVRIKAIEFLGRAGESAIETIPKLQPLTEDSDAEVREAAQSAIAQIRGQQEQP